MSNLSQRLRNALSDRYRVDRELGRGGMATVFLAEDLKHHRRVALKVLDPEVAVAIGPERFQREIETVARLTHPHILPLFDSGVADGLLFYAMPYVEGESLRDRLAREQQLPLGEALQIASEVADALGYAHQRELVHRDIKPENILLEEGHAVVADFGISRAVTASRGEGLTPTGVAVGTPTYMSPEQAAGSRVLDGRSDLYSLGCVLYEMLAGQPPFTGPTAESLAHQHMNVSPRPVTEIRTAVPPGVRDALAKSLAKTPADRFATTAEFAAELARAWESRAARADRKSRPGAHRAVWVAATAAIIIGLVAVAAWQLWDPFAEWLGDPGAAHAPKQRWIIVAEFEGPPEDPSIARAARGIVSAALDQSRVIATLPGDQIALALQQAGKPDTLPLTPRLAREIAFRSGVRMVLEGQITRLGDRFAVTLRVAEAERDTQVFVLNDVARSQDALIPMLGHMAVRVREKLGESRWALGLVRRGWYTAPTPSFAAYRLWADGIRLYNEMDPAGALHLYRAALAIDPDFATAWSYAADAYRTLGISDSVGFALMEALRRPERIDQNERLSDEGDLAMWQGNWRSALEIWERVRRLYPEDAIAENRVEGLLGMQGNLQGALDANSARIRKAGPLGAPPQVHLMRIGWLTALDRINEAHAEAARLPGMVRRRAELGLALAEHNWRRADSLATAIESDPRSSIAFIVFAIQAQATTAAVAGRLNAADDHLHRADELEHERGRPALASRAVRERVTLSISSGRPVPEPEAWLERDTTTSALITRGYAAAARGETIAARRLLAELRSRGSTRLGAHGSTPEFIEACIAAHSGRWGDVVALVSQAARDGSDRGSSSFDRIGIAPERLLAAQAYEQLGRPDSAVAFYSRLLNPDNMSRSLDTMARLRLAPLYAGMGRFEEAERHLATLERDVTQPDPDVRHMLDVARAAVRRMARPVAGSR